MKLKLNTAEFQNMVAKATKGSSGNTNLYMTKLIAIELKDNTLTLTTTDGSNYLYIRRSKVSGDDFYAVVPVDKFSKLVSKLTSEDVTLELHESSKNELDTLIIHGDGRYVIELPYDEDGELVEFPDPLSEISDSDTDTVTLKKAIVQMMLNTAKPSLMVGTKAPQYTGYYVGNSIVATDTYKICSINVPVFETPMILPAEFVDLLDVITDEDIDVEYVGDTIVFRSSDVIVYGTTLEGIDEYKIDAISAVVEQPYPSCCKVDKSLLLQLLDRLSLFVDTYDKNSIYLTFTKEGLEVSNKKDRGSERIPYIESTDFSDFTCCIDINMFKTQVKAYQSDEIEILYGQESRIKFVDGNIRQILALAEDDRFTSDEDGDDE